MPDFNHDIKIIVTIIENSKAKAFVLSSIDCPFDCHADELSDALENVMRTTDYEEIVKDSRKIRGD